MKKQRKLTYQKTYENHPIKTDFEKGYACDERILSAIKRTLDTSLDQSSKVMVVRYDVRFPKDKQIDIDNNEIFKTFQARFNKQLSRRKLKPKYVAVRESDTSTNPHFHVAMTLDGQKTQSPIKHMQRAEATLARILDLDPAINHGLIHVCDTDEGATHSKSAMLTRHDQATYDRTFHGLSYLAKVHTKPKERIRELFVSKQTKRKNVPSEGKKS